MGCNRLGKIFLTIYKSQKDVEGELGERNNRISTLISNLSYLFIHIDNKICVSNKI